MTKNGLQKRMHRPVSRRTGKFRTLSLTYTNACSKTINRWKKIFTQRKSYLLSYDPHILVAAEFDDLDSIDAIAEDIADALRADGYDISPSNLWSSPTFGSQPSHRNFSDNPVL